MEINTQIAEKILSEPNNIEKALNKLLDIQRLYKERGKRGYDSPFPKLDKFTQGIIEGKVYTIGAFSNTGKSQFSYEYASYFLHKGKKVMFVSTEVGTGDLLGYIARNFYRANYKDIMNGQKEIKIEDFKNLFLFDDIISIDEIKQKQREYKPDIIIIDFIQAINGVGGTEYEKMTNAAHEIQKLAIDQNITIFSLSQVNNDSRRSEGNYITLKGSGALFHASDVVFALYYDAGIVKLSIAKNKFGPAKAIFDVNIDFINGGKVNISESLEQEVTFGPTI